MNELYDMRDRVEQIMKDKKALRDLTNSVREQEYYLVLELAKRCPDILTINWGRLHRATGTTPLKYR